MSDQCYEEIVCPNKEAWLQTRRSGIGASEAAAVVGASPWKTALDLWGEKVGLVQDNVEETEAMQWGLRLEDAIAEAYSDESGRMVINPGRWTIARSTTHPFMQATLDREIVPIDERGPGLLEIKTTALYKRDEWLSEPPLQYLIQWQHQAAVRGVTWGSLAVLCGGQRFVWLDLERIDAFIEEMIAREREFWDLVEAQTPPTIDGSESAKELLKRLYPKEQPGKSVPLSAEALTASNELREVKEQLKDLEARETALKNALIAEIGEAEMGILSNGDAYTYKFLEKIAKKPVQVGDVIASYRELRFKAKKERR